MDSLDKDQFHNLIQRRRGEILDLNNSASRGTEAVELDQSKVGRLSRMDALQMQQMNLASERRRQIELIALQSALKRIEQGEFGICIECGNNINPKRLEIDLTATLCIACANTRESN